MKAIDIIWDIDEEDEGIQLPNEIKIPAGMTDEDEISDYITDETGFCHNGFSLDYEEKCPFCGGTKFAAHQVRCIDVVVNGRNEFLCYNTNDGRIGGALYGNGEPVGPYTCIHCGAEFQNLISMEVTRKPPKGEGDEPYLFLWIDRDVVGQLIRSYQLMNHNYQVHLTYDTEGCLVGVNAIPTVSGLPSINSRFQNGELTLFLNKNFTRSITNKMDLKTANIAMAEIKKLFMQ